jgi:hypothetical protein
MMILGFRCTVGTGTRQEFRGSDMEKYQTTPKKYDDGDV